nr:MAG TPA: hypothetical protein [Caudoviricetes sp.]
MNYDKNSFLAGISVGRTLKGWAGGAGGFGGGGNSITIIPVSKFVREDITNIAAVLPMQVIPVSDFVEEGEGK